MIKCKCWDEIMFMFSRNNSIKKYLYGKCYIGNSYRSMCFTYIHLLSKQPFRDRYYYYPNFKGKETEA